ncbi:hypothetical protein Pmar_PMAR005094 [Perkinsus marinus ATCC 50983]|uniref:Uncharacterized protein n=1 Tax=Perkinsus marinus (strain ATCC 50983 / TXsc) TaxID=423536 RepID=C5KAL3_PERM5|nr:hypothetical protein Pmar_PMAR005094 [Perkinsus marinus ATCC 50983]EER18189.1 hypothetical protein Pmar_PMAR005094 [Perkinsus marinus ATCC 50983]|eukprot:XP_002786393.1 hypothetical protein Pmar_PMAR005094 [Perkinsus marinus ATCC 50983]
MATTDSKEERGMVGEHPSVKRKISNRPTSRKLINSKSYAARLDGHSSMAYYGNNERYSLGIFSYKRTNSGFSLFFFDVEEMKDYPRNASFKRFLSSKGSFKGRLTTGCILGETFYFVIKEDEENIRRKPLDGKIGRPMKLPEPIVKLTVDACGEKLFAVGRSGKIYMMQEGAQGKWDNVMTLPKGSSKGRSSFEFEDAVVENGKVVKALLVKKEPKHERMWMHGCPTRICVWQSDGSAIHESGEVNAEAVKFVPGTDGRICCGVFYEDGDMNFFGVYDVFDNEFLTEPEEAIFYSGEEIDVSSVMVTEDWEVVVRGWDYRLKLYDAYPMLYITTLQLGCDDDDVQSKRVKSSGG